MFSYTRNRSIHPTVLVALMCAIALAGACAKREEGGSTSGGSPSSSAPKSAPPEFEGEVRMKVETGASPQMLMTYLIKEGRTRIETEMPDRPDAAAVVLWDLENGKVTTLMPQRKVYMTMDLKAMSERFGMREKSQGQDKETRLGKLTPTGKTETIAGHECEHWLMGDDQEIDMCVAKGMGFFGMGNNPFSIDALKSLNLDPKLLGNLSSEPQWARLVEGGAFPLKVTVLKKGRTEFTMEAMSIERKALADSLFEVPPDYKQINLPDRM